MATANAVKLGTPGTPTGGSLDGEVSVGESLRDVTMIVGTTAFYDIFTEWTGIVVGDMGQVSVLEELVCPGWFLAEVHQQVVGLYLDHESKVFEAVGQSEKSVSLVYACISAQNTANRLARKYASRLVGNACAQVTAAEDEFDAA